MVPLGIFSKWRFLIDPSFSYFFQSVWLNGWSRFENSFHKIFPPIDILAKLGSLICSSPSKIGLLTISQITKWNLVWFPLPLRHRKYLINLETSSMIDFGAKRKEDYWIGREESIALMRVGFPKFVSHWLPQDTILDLILLVTLSQSEGLLGPNVKGKPR